MLKSRCALLFLLFPCAAAAQYPGDEYYPYAEREERRELLTTDSTIFYRAVQSPSDLYGLRTGFNLPQVALRRRGLDYTLERTSLMGVAVSYRYLAALRLLGAEEQRYAGLAAAPGEPAAAGGMRAFRFSDGEPLQPFLASVRFTDRNYLVGAKAAVSASPGDGWRISAALDARSGRDMHVEGVFTNAVTAGLRLARRFGEGHELSVLCIVPPSVRGTRLSSSEEAFTLTGDRLYNPAWGWQDGRVRNSRVRRETVPLALAAYAVPLSASTSFAATLAAEAGVAKYSMLDWYDARTPMPDNYRYLPSYTGDRETEQAWLARDPRYTQIDWDELIRQNRMAGGHAVYALEDRVERLCNLAFDASFATEADARLTLRYGVSLRRENTCSYKQMRDLLGAGVRYGHRPLPDRRRHVRQSVAERPAASRTDGPRGRPLRLRLCADAARGCAPLAGRLPLRPFPGRSFGRAGERCRQPPGLLREGTFSRRAVLRPFARHAVHALHAQGRGGLGLHPAPLYRNRRRGRRPDPSGRGSFLSAAL
ncbi:MAG: hypothetical protein ACLVK4_13630 [Alistipes shahii]|uniref:hypothetical protein n=1 Tax=Alistipes shahii TaxID=328814 RepID=UPI00399D5604